MRRGTGRRNALAIAAALGLLLAGCGDGGADSGNGGAGAGVDDALVGGGDVVDNADALSDVGGVGTVDSSSGDAAGVGDSGGDGGGDAGSDTTTDTAVEGCPGGEGCACTENSDCDNSVCLDTADGKRCAKTCIEDCPKGFTCGKLGASDATFVCIPDHLTTCSPCTTNADCQYQQADSLCLDYGDGGRFCGGPCKVDDDCPGAGYACISVLDEASGQTKSQCKLKAKAAGGSGAACTEEAQCAKGETCLDGACAIADQPLCGCTAWAKSAAKSSPCKVTNDNGTCAGTRTCSAAGLTACTAQTPAVEDCDGVDDDCNGITDDLPASVTCEQKAWLPLGSKATCTDDAGCTEAGESCDPADGLCKQLIGACPGKPVCVGGKTECQQAKTPKLEACNGDDDDCDGATDESFTWTHPSTQAAVAVGGACGVGPCAGGLVQCETLLAAVCTTEQTLSKAEACNDVDDDCDGATDDGTCDDGNECTTDKCDGKSGTCSNPFAVTCDDKNPCTTDSCDKQAGKCVFSPYQGSCDDGDACTEGDLCGKDKAGAHVCLPGATPKDCDDNNLCTDDSCDPTKGCVQLANAVTATCYSGAKGSEGKGLCKAGVRFCKDGKAGATCVGEVTPAATEACDGLDDSCNGVTDEGCKAAAVGGSFATAYGTAQGQVAGKAGSALLELGGSSPAGEAKGKTKTLRGGFIAWLMSVLP